MANHKGSEGLVKIGTNTVAEVTGWSLEQTAEVIEDTELSDTAKSFKSDLTSWNGSIECHLDETDTNGQEAMTIGAEVTLHLLPEGDTTGDLDMYGSAIITGISEGGAIGGMVTRSFTFQGNGALTIGTAA